MTSQGEVKLQAQILDTLRKFLVLIRSLYVFTRCIQLVGLDSGHHSQHLTLVCSLFDQDTVGCKLYF